jgi:hypothetical protein
MYVVGVVHVVAFGDVDDGGVYVGHQEVCMWWK